MERKEEQKWEIKCKEVFMHMAYYINRVLFPPAKVIFIFWTLYWMSSLPEDEGTSFGQKIIIVIFGYFFMCGIADLIYAANKKRYLAYRTRISQKKIKRLRRMMYLTDPIQYESQYGIDEIVTERKGLLQRLLYKEPSDAEKAQMKLDRAETIQDVQEPIYHDRFDKEYRKVDSYREIRFTGDNFNFPEVQISAALLLYQSRKGCKIGKNDDYSRYYEGRYGIVNISKLHKWLYENGYLRDATLQEALGLYKVPELKTILDSLGLKKTGKKADLMERIISAIDQKQKEEIVKKCDKLFLSEKGQSFLNENYDLVLYHRSQYDISISEFSRYRFIGNKKRTFNDTAFQVLSQKAYIYQTGQDFSKMEMLYHNLSNICYENGKEDLALQYELYRMYFSTNLCSRTYLFDKDFVKYNGVENLKSRIDSLTVFNQHMLNRIVELRAYFSEQLLDVVYTPEILPYCLFGKHDMLDAVQDLYDDALDVEKYTQYIRSNYEKYTRKLL